jgi:hypothetical protein
MSAVTDRADAKARASALHELAHWKTEGVEYGGEHIPPEHIESVLPVGDFVNLITLKGLEHRFFKMHTRLVRPALP